MTIEILSKRPEEGGVGKFTFTFYDEDGTAVTPNWLEWRLTDEYGTVINALRGQTSVPSTSVIVGLTGNDLVILHEYDTGKRLLTMEGQYDSNLGSDLPLKKVVEFMINKSPSILSGNITVEMGSISVSCSALDFVVA